MEGAHSTVGASSSGRWMKCPGSVALCAQVPDKDPGVYAKEGSFAHEQAELVLMGGSIEDLAHDKIPQDLKQVITDLDDFKQNITVYTDHVKEVLSAGPARKLYVEQPFDLNWLHPGMYGTNDACVLEAYGTLFVFDLKYGRKMVVEVKENSQLMYYALGALYKHRDHEFNNVAIVVVQPRAYHPAGQIRRWDISPEDLMAWGKNVLKPAAELALGKNAPLVPGDWCNSYFCPARGEFVERGGEYVPLCSALQEKMYEVAKLDFSTPVEEVRLPNPKELDSSAIAKVLKVSALLSSWVNEVKSYAIRHLDAGGDIPGFKLVEHYGNRKWKDEDEIKTALMANGFGSEIFTEPKLKSPSQMESIKKEGMTKKDIKAMLKQYQEKPYKGKTLAEESSEKPAIEASVYTDFAGN